MKILHTADWHLGKRLGHFSRLEEQREVLEEICEIADREAVDMVLIAGDMFDHINPSTEALELFYKTLKQLAHDGKRPVIGIAGNHDSPDRIEAPDPLARECGILLSGYPNSQIKPFQLDTGLKIIHSEPGFMEIEVPNIPHPVRLILTPYANELRLKKYLGNENPEDSLRQVLQEQWGNLAEKYCNDKGVNLLMTHLFFIKQGGERLEEPEDEKPILTVGGAQEVYTSNLPTGIQYVALGHLHRQHVVGQQPCPVVYSGSPLAYSMSEAGQQKYISILEVEPGRCADIQQVSLSKGKGLVRKKFDDFQEALNWLVANPHTWVELTLVSDTYLTAEQRKQLHDAHSGIVTLIPQIVDADLSAFTTSDIDLSKDLQHLFMDYFKHKHGQAPDEPLMDLLKEVLAEETE